MFRDWLYKKAWPSYKCEDCIGMIEHGCECSYHQCIAPCVPVDWAHLFLRWLYAKIY